MTTHDNKVREAIVTFRARTLLTDDQNPLYIPAVDVTVEHQALTEIRRDAKPFKNTVGTDNINEAQKIAEERLAIAAADVILQQIMAFLSTI